MSYHFKDSGYPGEDYLIVTKKEKRKETFLTALSYLED